jgi:hypothetical protein
MQSEKNSFLIMYLIAKDNTSTYNKFLCHIFEFGQDLRDVGVPELVWKTFCVSEPQDMKTSQLCMNHGGAENQIPYVCHLCQKHSVNIARPNRMTCGTCSRMCDQGVYYLYPILDSDVITMLLENKETLGKNDEAHRLTFVCEQIYGGDWMHIMLLVICIWLLLDQRRARLKPLPQLIPKSMPLIWKML